MAQKMETAGPSPSPSPRERLEVPYMSALERKLVVTSDFSTKQQRPNITPTPQSSVLDRVRGFLPQMAAANTKLQEDLQVRPASDFDIENVPEDGEGTYVQMDISCGMFELRDAAAVRAAEKAVAMGATNDPLSQFEAGSSGDDSSDEDSEVEASGRAAPFLTAREQPVAQQPAAAQPAAGGRRKGGGGEAPGPALSVGGARHRQPRVAARRHNKIVEIGGQ